ncbi:MAG: glycosyltransferase family 2 protein, partial [Vicinamibacterales bacterium]
VVEIPHVKFNHGGTRNLGISECRGAYVALLVQDAIPSSPDWLTNLVTPLLSDDRLAGTYARQVPRSDASAVTRHYLLKWAATSLEHRVAYVDNPATFDALPPANRLQVCTFDNVCSCIRRAVWGRIPFKATPIAEDLEWAHDVLLAGHGLAYVPDAVVVHSHERSARYELSRTYLLHQRLRSLFGLATIPDLPSLIRSLMTTIPSHLKWTVNGSSGTVTPRALARALALAFAFPLGQYLGSRSIDTGRELLNVKGV